MNIVGLNRFLTSVDEFVPSDARVVGIAGGSGSGKSYVARLVAEGVGARMISVDDYIIPEKITKDSNWDLPECWDLDLLDMNLRDFLSGRDFEKPVYSFKSGLIDRYEDFESGGRVVVEGLYALCDLIAGRVDFSIFVDSSEDIRLARVVKRDTMERNKYDEAKIVERWNRTIQPAFLEYVESQRDGADLVLLN